ncbi:MAG: hypothetical protein NVS2B3_18580 [Vulcanimicrobiaceae bacterium]
MQTFLFHHPSDAGTVTALRDDVAAALAAGERAIAIDLDDVRILESSVIATLLALRRVAKASGATISLCASRPALVASLRVTALDKVFAIVTCERRQPLPPVRTKPGAPRAVGRFVAVFVAGTLALATLLGSRAFATGEPSPDEILRAVIAQNADMRSYQARVSVDLHVRSFPYVSQHLDGTTYYKRPDNFEVVFEKVPSYAKGFDKLYSDIDDPTSWSKRFDVSYVGEREVDGHRDYVLRLVQRVRGMIDHQEVSIDPASWHVDAMSWSYYNGGTIAMTQEYQRVGNFNVLARQHATIRIPFVHAAAEARYYNYQTNVAIDDSIFTHEKRR